MAGNVLNAVQQGNLFLRWEMENIHLSKFTTKLQGLCHDGFSLYDVVVREGQENGSFCDREIKNVAIDEVKKQAVFVLKGNSRINELETENTRLRVLYLF